MIGRQPNRMTSVLQYIARVEPANSPWVFLTGYAQIYNIDGNSHLLVDPTFGSTADATAYQLSYTMKTGTCFIQYAITSDSGFCDVFVEFDLRKAIPFKVLFVKGFYSKNVVVEICDNVRSATSDSDHKMHAADAEHVVYR